ncbi:MAG: tetratricopeptide repeat protein [Candidatus Latescibacterota bacterium]
MTLTLLLGLVTVGGALLAFRAPTESELVALFGEGQRFYAEGAYGQAVAQYERVSQVHSTILDVRSIEVAVGEERYPVQEAALYQIGNAYSKTHAESGALAAEAIDPERRDQYRAQADTALVRAVRAFEQVIEQAASPVLRGRAHGRLVEVFYEAKAYPQVVETASRLADSYGDTPEAVTGYYNTGWAYYEMKEYGRAVEAFAALLARFPTGYQADRSLFQIGECYLEMGDYARAIGYYRQLVERQQIEELGEEELRRIRREKLAGLVDETALELAAKAEIRVGTCHARLGQYDKGLEAYQRVIALFGSERQLVEEAYLRMADLHQQRGDMEAALQTYRQAMERSTDRVLRARIQYALAERLFSQGRYQSAAEEYRVYLRGYGDVAGQAGFAEERVRHRIGSAYQQLGEERLAAGDGPAGSRWLELAVAQYDTVLAVATPSERLDSRFNRALALQTLASAGSLERARQDFELIIAETREPYYVQRAMVQLAELHAARGEHAAAAQHAQRLLESYPEGDFADQAHMRLALSRQAQGEVEAAVQAFLAIPEDSPSFASARLGCGHAHLTLRQYDRAAQVLEAGLARAGDDQRASFHYLLGQAYAGLQSHRQAVTHYGAALALPVERRLAEALRLGRGSEAVLLEDWAQGEEDFGWVVEHSEDADRIAYAQDALAMAYLRQDRGGAAIAVLEEMVASAQSPEERARLLGRVMDLHYQQDEYAQTARVARTLLALDFPDSASAGQPYGLKEKAQFLLGDALLRLGQAAQGVEVFTQALRSSPDSFFALSMRLNLATHYFAAGELERAREEFSRLAGEDLDPEQRRTVGFYLANIHYSLRDFAEARRLFAGVLRDHPVAQELPDVLFGLGESHYQLGEFEAAIGYYQRLLAQFPAEPAADDALYNMAWCLIELKREEEAMAAFSRLLQRYPDSEFAASARFSLGDNAYNRGAFREAQEAYSEVARRYPGAPVAAQVPHLLEELEEAMAYQRYEQGLAQMDSAEATGQEEHFERAIALFAQVRELFPGTESEVGALSNMGVCLEGLGRWQEAVEVYDQVIELYAARRATTEAFEFARAHRDWIVTTRL